MRAAEGVEHRLARVVPEYQRAALVGGVPGLVRVGHDEREPQPAEDAPGLSHQPLVRPGVVGRIGEANAAIGFHGHAIVRVRQVLRHHQPIHPARAPRVVGPHRNPRHHRLCHHAVRAALRLDLPQRIRRVGPAQVEVVDGHRLLEHRVVLPKGVEALHHGGQVRHVTAPHQARRVGQAMGVRVGGRPQQERRRVHGAARDNHQGRVHAHRLPRPLHLHALHAGAGRVGVEPPRVRLGPQRHVGLRQHGVERAHFRVALGADAARERIARVAHGAAARLAGTNQPQRQRRRVQPLLAQAHHDLGHPR